MAVESLSLMDLHRVEGFSEGSLSICHLFDVEEAVFVSVSEPVLRDGLAASIVGFFQDITDA